MCNQSDANDTQPLCNLLRWRSAEDLPDVFKVDFDCYESRHIEILLKNGERFNGYLTVLENEYGALKRWIVFMPCASGHDVEVSQELISAWHYLQPLPTGEIK